MDWRQIGFALALLLGLAVPCGVLAGVRVLDGLAIVQQDGTLRIDGETVHLYGIYLPQFERTCSRIDRPPRCGAPSVLVLDDLVEGFVQCQVVREGRNAVLGICTQPGRELFGPREDIAATLVRRGWALAADDAPAQYRALEALAKSREVGLWGPKILNLR